MAEKDSILAGRGVCGRGSMDRSVPWIGDDLSRLGRLWRCLEVDWKACGILWHTVAKRPLSSVGKVKSRRVIYN